VCAPEPCVFYLFTGVTITIIDVARVYYLHTDDYDYCSAYPFTIISYAQRVISKHRLYNFKRVAFYL